MGYYIITFRSVTPAQTGERLLRQAGIRCSLGRTPRWMEVQGCGYSLRVDPEQVEQTLALFRERKLPFRKVYYADDHGRAEERAL